MVGVCRITLIRKAASGLPNSSGARVAEGLLETWFEHDQGRLLAVVTNDTRAMVMLLNEPGDAGEHATDPSATGQQGGYVLGNGQHDTYDNRDTVPLGQALMIVEHLLDHGRPPAGVGWHIDRQKPRPDCGRSGYRQN